MRYLIKWLGVLVLLATLLQPVSAVITPVTANSTLYSSSYVHDYSYIPAQYEYVLVIIGLASLAISRIWKDADDIFSIGAVIPLAMSAWFANYMTSESIIASPTNTVVYTQIIIPNIYLSITMLVFTIAALLNVYWIFFLQPSDDSKTPK